MRLISVHDILCSVQNNSEGINVDVSDVEIFPPSSLRVSRELPVAFSEVPLHSKKVG